MHVKQYTAHVYHCTLFQKINLDYTATNMSGQFDLFQIWARLEVMG